MVLRRKLLQHARCERTISFDSECPSIVLKPLYGTHVKGAGECEGSPQNSSRVTTVCISHKLEITLEKDVLSSDLLKRPSYLHSVQAIGKLGTYFDEP